MTDINVSDSGAGAEDPIVLEPSEQSDILAGLALVEAGVGADSVITMEPSEQISIDRFPAPSPASSRPPGFGFGSGGKVHEAGMTRPLRGLHSRGSKLGSLVGKMSGDFISTITENLKKSAPADPMEALTREAPPDKVKEGIIRELRKRIAVLEDHIQKLKAQHTRAIGEWKATVTEKMEELDELQEAAVKLEDDLRVEVVRAAAYQAARAKASVMMGGIAEEPPSKGVGKLIIAAITYLAVEALIPDRMGGLKDAGRTVAAGVAISGLMEMIR